MLRRAVLLRPPILLAAQTTTDAGLPVRGGGHESGVACDMHPTPTRSGGSANEEEAI